MSSVPNTRRNAFSVTAALFAVLLAIALLFAVGGGEVDAKKSKKSASKSRLPSITNVSPLRPFIGDKLTITGRNLVKGKKANVFIFQRKGSKRKFTMRGNGTSTKSAVVEVPDVLADLIPVDENTFLLPTDNQYRVRVVTKYGASKTSTAPAISPVIAVNPNGPAKDKTAPDADCDSDGIINSADPDDDNDLMMDVEETAQGTNICKSDTDGDQVSDYYEWRVSYERNGGTALPYPSLRPYPNPLVGDSELDYDGDEMEMILEYKAWQFTGRPDRFYSDANQDSDGDGRMDAAEDEDGDLLPNIAEFDLFIGWALGAELNFVKTDTDGDGLCDGLDDEDHDGPPTQIAMGDCTTVVPNNGTASTPDSPAGLGDPDSSRIDGDDNRFSNYYEWAVGSTGDWYQPCFPEGWPTSKFCKAPINYW